MAKEVNVVNGLLLQIMNSLHCIYIVSPFLKITAIQKAERTHAYNRIGSTSGRR